MSKNKQLVKWPNKFYAGYLRITNFGRRTMLHGLHSFYDYVRMSLSFKNRQVLLGLMNLNLYIDI
ncbi:hypothetical protein [Paenibacillus castaneae]|uniref:hypothetical protein n=1 Tax=Paenibacillus castaneae TaxID=474957 RepID=UPI001ABA582C|nr:hypothetical protein [Paenibacillus castaneae]